MALLFVEENQDNDADNDDYYYDGNDNPNGHSSIVAAFYK